MESMSFNMRVCPKCGHIVAVLSDSTEPNAIHLQVLIAVSDHRFFDCEESVFKQSMKPNHNVKILEESNG